MSIAAVQYFGAFAGNMFVICTDTSVVLGESTFFHTFPNPTICAPNQYSQPSQMPWRSLGRFRLKSNVVISLHDKVLVRVRVETL